MKIGICGYQGSGKSSLFQWLTGVEPDLAKAHVGQAAMCEIPEARIEDLCKIYKPKKITRASLQLVDTPGLSRDQEGNAARLGHIRDTGCLIMMVPAYAGVDPADDLQQFSEDLLLADLEILSGRIARLRESVKKPRPTRDQEMAELEALEPLEKQLEAGELLREAEMSEVQLKSTRSFQLLTQKPRLAVVNVADDEDNLTRFGDAAPDGTPLVAVPVGLECELARMSPEDREEFRAEMGVTGADRDGLLRKIMEVSGQMLFFTAGEKEVRTWLFHQGGTAVEAADTIHSDMARCFIRAETMTCDDLTRLGSEREVKAAGLVRQEPKDYVVQDGDVFNFLHNA